MEIQWLWGILYAYLVMGHIFNCVDVWQWRVFENEVEQK